MSTNADTPAWVVAASGMGKVRHMRRVKYQGDEERLVSVCGTNSRRWLPLAEQEVTSLPACTCCVRQADRDALWELEASLRAAEYRINHAAGLRETADMISRGHLPFPAGSRLGPWSHLPIFADDEQEAAFIDAAKEVRGWLREAAAALDPPEEES
jgi:hypothetical protein